MSTQAYHDHRPAVNPQPPLTWPQAITTIEVRYLLRELGDLGARVEVGPSTHPTAWNRLHLPDGATYRTAGASPWWALECTCNGVNRESCAACREAARRVYCTHPNRVTEWVNRGNAAEPDPDLVDYCPDCGQEVA